LRCAERDPLALDQHLVLLEMAPLLGRDPLLLPAHETLGQHLRLGIGRRTRVALGRREPLALVLDLAEEGVRPGVLGLELEHALHGLLGLRAQLLRFGPLAQREEVRGALGGLEALVELLRAGLALLDPIDLRHRELEVAEAGRDLDLGRVLRGDRALDAPAVLQHQHVGQRAAREEHQRKSQPTAFETEPHPRGA